MGLLALVPLGFLGISLLGINERGMQDAVLELHTKLAEKLAGGLGTYLKTVDSNIRFAIAAIQRSNLPFNERKELLQGLIESSPDIDEISILNREGKELLKVSRDPNSTMVARQGEPAYDEFAKTGKRTIWVTPRNDQAPVLEIYYPLHDVLNIRVSLQLKSLWASVAEERVGGTGFAMVVDRQGRPILYPPELLPFSMRTSIPRWPIVTQALTAVSIGSAEFTDPAQHIQVGAYAPVQELGGAVIIQQPKNEAFRAAAQMKRTAFVLFFVFGAAAITVAFFMAKRMTEPLLALTKGAQEVSKGHFPGEVQIKTGDELQDLAEVFNFMVSSLKRYAELQVDRLIQEQQKTEAILFSIADGILMTDDEGHIQLANRRAREILGVAVDDTLEGKKLTDFMEHSLLREAILYVCANPDEKIPKEVDLSTEQYRRFIRVAACPVVHPKKGTKVGIVTALRDVTFEKQLDKMKEEFLNSITHDLRNPIGSIVGFTEFLIKGTVGVLNPQQTNMVSGIQKAGSRLLSMVNNILDAAKMESGRIELRLKVNSVTGIASHAIDVLGALAQRRGLKVELQAEEEFSVNCDGDLVERVCGNLIGNAIKFAAEDGKIIVSIKDDGDSLKLCVQDDGDGIPPQYLTKIFEKFEQVPGQRRGGTGLGLTISRHIIEAHLGKIWVESELGKGARFYFTMPKDLAVDELGHVIRTDAAPPAEKVT